MSTSLRIAVLVPLLTLSAGRARDGVELRWHGKVGDVQRHRVMITQKFQLPGMPDGIKTDYAMVLRQEVKAVSPEGVGSIELRYEAFKILSAGMMALDFDSTRQGDDAKKNSADTAAQFAAMKDATVHLEIEPSGHLRSIQGVKEAQEKAFPAAASARMPSPLRQTFGEEALRRMVEVNAFPDGKVAVGDTWPSSQAIKNDMVGTLKFSNQNKLAGTEKHGDRDCAKIEIEGSVTLEAGAPMQITLDDSDVHGTELVALDSGCLVELTTKSVLDMSASMGGNEQQMTVTTEQHIVALAKDEAPFP